MQPRTYEMSAKVQQISIVCTQRLIFLKNEMLIKKLGELGLLTQMSLTFFSERGSRRPPRISKFFFRGGGGPEGPGGKQGVNRILEGGQSPRRSFQGVQGVGFYLIELIFQALNAYSLFKVYISMFLAKIKGNKVHFWKFVPFGKGGGLFTPYRPPRPPRSCSRGSPAQNFSKRGGQPKF